LVSRASPWLGALWLTAMPARFALALLVARLLQLGPKAHEHGAYLIALSYAALGLWLVSLYGRQVWVRACRQALEGTAPRGAAGWRVPLRELAGASVAALFVELFFWLASFTVLVPIAMLPAAALAATAAPRAGPGVVKPLGEMARSAGSLWTLSFLMSLMLLGLLLAMLNLGVLFSLAAWVAQPLLGIEAAAWPAVLSGQNPLFVIVLAAGATLLVEPFWLAAMTVHVEKVRATSSGEDLRRAFAELRARDSMGGRAA
jgi:hypothetical protein